MGVSASSWKYDIGLLVENPPIGIVTGRIIIDVWIPDFL